MFSPASKSIIIKNLKSFSKESRETTRHRRTIFILSTSRDITLKSLPSISTSKFFNTHTQTLKNFVCLIIKSFYWVSFFYFRLLGFYRVPPTVGRVFNITSELWDNADEELAKTFFYSPGGNTCFTGHCSYYCDSTHATCGRPKDRLEASVQVYLPSKPIIQWKAVIHPYRRTYTKKKKAEWEKNEKYCVYKLFQDLTYHSKLFLDLIDLSIFDFLTSNMDRHHYERMVTLNDNSFIVHVDNGRSFGKIFSDEMSILAPLRQCCIIRYSTYERLKSLYKNRFSKLLDNSLRSDPLYPILTMNHFKAIDRRMDIIFHTLMNCTQFLTPTEVIIDDGY